jgi:phosphate-selective porin OprO/OprP
MQRGTLGAVVSLLLTGFALGQEAAPNTSSPFSLRTTPPLQPAASTSTEDEITELRRAISQLEQRLNRISPDRPHSSPLAPSASSPSDPPCAEPAGGNKGSPLSASWNNGLEFASQDDAFRVHVGGRLQFDVGWNMAGQAVQFGPGGTGDLEDGALFRRATVRIDGEAYRYFQWMAEFDFANSIENDTSTNPQQIGSPAFTEVWMGVNELPMVGTVRVGWQKEPIGFEHLMSSNFYSFLERSPGSDSLGAISPGVLWMNRTEDECVTAALGVFHAQNDNFGFGFDDGQYAYTGRLTCLAWDEEDGAELLHLGVGASHRHLNNDVETLRGRPSVRTMPGSMEPTLADTGAIGGRNQDVVDLELAGVYGSWTLQSEYYTTWIHDALVPNEPPPQGVPLGTLFYQGAYVQVLYFLTGEHQSYDRRNAVFDRVVPLRNFNIWDGSPGWGAWQVGFRYGYLDLQDKGVNGATLNDLVLGLNWFLNPNAKIQWNLACDHRDSTPAGSSGWTYVFGSRLAVNY